MARAVAVRRFLESLTYTAGPKAGHQFRCTTWQWDILLGIYGPVTKIGRRIVKTAVISMPRKNGKTELIAGLVLCHLCGPEAELNGQVYSAAADKEQAALIFNAAAAMVRADRELSEVLGVIDSRKRIVHYQSGSVFRALSRESKTKHGLNPSFVAYDELAQATDRKLYDVLTTGGGARAEPLFVAISVQGDDPNNPMGELVDYGRRVESGEIDDPTFRMWLYEAPDGCAVDDRAAWAVSNPALGDFRSVADIESMCSRAMVLPEAERTFRLLFLNQRVSTTPEFVPKQLWLGCEDKALDLESLRGLPAAIGLDLSSTTDLTAIAVAAKMPDARVALVMRFYLPEKGIKEREDRDKVPYRTWVKQGWLTLTPGAAVNKRIVLEDLLRIKSVIQLTATAFDRWRIEDLKAYATEMQVSEDLLKLVEHGQGFKDMAPAIDALEAELIGGRLVHDASPVMNWCLSNCVVSRDPAGNRKLDKARARGRIDGAVAAVMAVRTLQQAPAPKRPRISSIPRNRGSSQ